MLLFVSFLLVSSLGSVIARSADSDGTEGGHENRPCAEFVFPVPHTQYRLHVEAHGEDCAPLGAAAPPSSLSDNAPPPAGPAAGRSPAAHPLLYFHGGWGPLNGDLEVVPADFFTIYFHQRGWGLSEPAGDITNNTLSDVIDDAQLLHAELVPRPPQLHKIYGSTGPRLCKHRKVCSVGWEGG